MTWWTNAPRYTAATWPLAFGMMSSGLPQAIAWPLADANRALMDATDTAAKPLMILFLPTAATAAMPLHKSGSPKLRNPPAT